jgi:hypothetical protein
MEDYRDDSEAVEDLPEPSPPVASPEVPEADALEQAQDVRPAEDEVPDELGLVPEADALEQARAAGEDDRDDYR